MLKFFGSGSVFILCVFRVWLSKILLQDSDHKVMQTVRAIVADSFPYTVEE